MVESIRKLGEILSYVRSEINSDMALPQLSLFLQICQEEGITMITLSKRLKMPQGSLSRNLKMLSQFFHEEKGKHELKGYNLIDLKPDLYDRKRLACFLTSRGRAVRQHITNIMGEIK